MASLIFEKRNTGQVILLSVCGIVLFNLCKDLLHAFVRDYQFYLSESLLFGSFWLLFIPLVLLNRWVFIRFGRGVYLVLPVLLSFLHIAVFSLLVNSISGLFFSYTFDFIRVFSETLADFGLACLLIYCLLNFIFLKYMNPAIEVRKSLKKIRVAYKGKVKLIGHEDIIYLKTERPYIALVTEERTYLHNSTLKHFIEVLPENNFIQIHKSTVVNTDHIRSYKSRQNGDYDVSLHNGDTLRVSRNFNSFFKSYSKVNHLD